MSINTFQIQQEYLALHSLLSEVDEETGEFINSAEDIKEYIDALAQTRDQKLINIERYKRDVKGQSETVANEIKRLQGLKKQYDNQVEKLSELEMILTQGEKIDTGLYKFGVRKSKSVEVPDDVDLSLSDFVNTSYSWDKKALKKELDKGISYEEYGISLVEKESLSVR